MIGLALLDGLASNWEGIVLAVGGLVTTASLAPTLLDRESVVPLSTSLSSAAIITATTAAYASMDMSFAAVTAVLSAAEWFAIAVFRSDRRSLPGAGDLAGRAAALASIAVVDRGE